MHLTTIDIFNRFVESETDIIYQNIRYELQWCPSYIVSSPDCAMTKWDSAYTNASEKEDATGVLCTGLRGKWPSNSLDVPWSDREGGPLRDTGEEEREHVIREKVPRAKRKWSEREKDSLENRCATIDRRLRLPTELSYTFLASAIGRFNRVDYRRTVCLGWGQLRWVTG